MKTFQCNIGKTPRPVSAVDSRTTTIPAGLAKIHHLDPVDVQGAGQFQEGRAKPDDETSDVANPG